MGEEKSDGLRGMAMVQKDIGYTSSLEFLSLSLT